MSESFLHALRTILSAVKIHSATSFSIGNGPRVDANPKLFGPQWGTNPQSPGYPLAPALQTALYSSCYMQPLETTLHPPAKAQGQPAASGPNFANRLSQANRSRERWDQGWVIHQLGQGGTIFVHKGERHRTARPGEFAGSGMAPQPNQVVSLQVLRESFQLQPGFYFVFGETLSDEYDDFSMMRFYFHIAPEGAPLLIQKLTTDLNRFQVPFRMKCLTDPAQYVRSDSAVLYVAQRFFRVTTVLLATLAGAEWLRPWTPLFTKQLAPGLAVAEDPGNGESFGMHRCRLVAEGIVDAWMQGTQSVQIRIENVRQRFLQNGLTLERPYMRDTSADIYEFPAPVELCVEKRIAGPALATEVA